MIAAAAGAALIPLQAQAQLALSASVTSDFRYRGISLGSDQPAATLTVGYDVPVQDSVGAYFAGSVSLGRFPDAGFQVFDHSEAIGLAGEVAPGVGWDVGVSNISLTYDYGSITTAYDPELYAGVRTRLFSYYVRYSPHYFATGAAALYTEVDGSFPIKGPLRLLAHVGAATPIASPAGRRRREQYDASLGLATRFKGIGLSAAWTFQRPGRPASLGPRPPADAVAVTATVYF